MNEVLGPSIRSKENRTSTLVQRTGEYKRSFKLVQWRSKFAPETTIIASTGLTQIHSLLARPGGFNVFDGHISTG